MAHLRNYGKCTKDPAPMKILFVTTDRLSPWNGKRQEEPDHIWADLPDKLNSPLLICTLEHPVQTDFDYKFGAVSLTCRKPLDSVRAFLLFLIGVTRSRTERPSFLLDVTFRRIFARFKRLLLRQSWPSKDVFLWHRSVILLTRSFRRLRPDVVVFHNEFSPWGAAVKWSAIRAGIPAIAHQHYAVSSDLNSSPYGQINRWTGLLPDGLLCISEDQVARWSSLPIPVSLGGSRRGTWNIEARREANEGGSGLLFVPALGDSDELEEAISEFPGIDFHVKPHPSSKCSWSSHNVSIHEGDLASVASRFAVVVTSSPSPIITLTMLRKPYVRVTSYGRVGTCQCSEEISFTSFREVIAALASGDRPESLASSGCRHNSPPELSRSQYEANIRGLLETKD